MRTHIVHDDSGEILWMAVQDSETRGELEVEVGEGESILTLDMGTVAIAPQLRDQHIQQRVKDIAEGDFRVDVARRELVRRDESD